MAIKTTWTKKGITHARRPSPHTVCGLDVPYKTKVVKKPGKAKRKKNRVERDRRPRPVTCIDCLAMMDNQPLRINLTESLRGLSADMVYIDEPMEVP